MNSNSDDTSSYVAARQTNMPNRQIEQLSPFALQARPKLSALPQGHKSRILDPTLLADPYTFSLLCEYLWRHRHDPQLRRIQHSFLGETPLSMFVDPETFHKNRFLNEARFRHSGQRPDTFYIPHLPPIPYPNPDQVSAFLEENIEIIAAEFEASRTAEVTSPSSALATRGRWATLPLMRAGRPDQEGIARCPRTWEIVRQLPLLIDGSGAVYFSILAPNTQIRPHFGPTNARWRYHLVLNEAHGAKIRVGGSWRGWRQGKCLIIDDSFEHEVIHSGDSPRCILLVDAWRPELTEAERTFIAGLYRHLRANFQDRRRIRNCERTVTI